MSPLAQGLLYKWVQSVRAGKQLQLDLATMEKLYNTELKDGLADVAEDLAPTFDKVLPSMLQVYIYKWPDWNLLRSREMKDMPISSLTESLKDYLTMKVNQLIEKEFRAALEVERKRVKVKADAPFTIDIHAPGPLINSFLFSTERDTDHVVLKSHETEDWVYLTTSQLVNWPHIKMSFISPELSFKRAMTIHYNRGLSIGLVKNSHLYMNYKADATPVESVQNLDTSAPRNCFTTQLLTAYVQQYADLIKKRLDVDVTAERLEEIETVLAHFIYDLYDVNFKETVATNTLISFVLSKKAKYIRHTKFSSHSNFAEIVDYSEVIIPKTEFCLDYFNAIQDSGSETFVYLNSLVSDLEEARVLLPIIEYGCGYCKLTFDTKAQTVSHLKAHHTMEANVLCKVCKAHYSVLELTNNRWNHNCQELIKL